MRTELCERLGIEYPIFAFTPSEKVAAAVSRAGGLGVLGAVRFNDSSELDDALTWMDENTDGKPYGVDVVMPMKIPTEGTSVDLKAMIPGEHISFVEETLRKLGVPPLPEGEGREGVLGWLHSTARSHVDVALQHRPVLIANALGTPPKDVIDLAHEHNVLVAALAGAGKHAASHVADGVDIIVSQGYEAGGHTGEIASMVLTPEIVDAVGPNVPVLAAGGIGCGRQVAASLALGAQGVWTGSLWLTVPFVICAVLVPVVTLHFFLVYPERNSRRKSRSSSSSTVWPSRGWITAATDWPNFSSGMPTTRTS